MRILFNCSTTIKGGAVQNAANFILESLSDVDISYVYAVSPQVKSLLINMGVDVDLFLISPSPSKNRLSRLNVRNLAIDTKCDFVYTMAGPSYVNFACPHLLGLSDPYITHATFKAFFYNRGFVQGVLTLLTVCYKFFWTFFADGLIFQTDYARRSYLSRRFSRFTKTWIVPNSVGNIFSSNYSNSVGTNQYLAFGDFKVFYPAADYPHKALMMIPHVACLLKEMIPSKTIVFYITINFDSDTWKDIQLISEKLGVSGLVLNIGPYSYEKSATLYSESDVVFFPSILETFSTSYIEALFSNRPLIVPDLGFVRDICHDAAFYYKPYSLNDSALLLANVLGDLNRARSSKQKFIGEVLSAYGRSSDRYIRLKSIFTNFYGKIND